MKNIFTELFKFSFTSTKECLFWICSGTFLMVLYSNKTLLFTVAFTYHEPQKIIFASVLIFLGIDI